MRPPRRGPSWAEYLRFVRAFRRERGLVLVQVAPALLAAHRIVLPTSPHAWALPVQIGAAALLAAAGLALPWRPWPARALAVLAALLGAAPLVPLVGEHPESLLLGAVALWMVLHLILSEPSLVTMSSAAQPDAGRTARAGSAIALALWFVEVLGRVETPPLDAGVTAAPLAFAGLLGARWAWREPSRPWLPWVLGCVIVAALAGAALTVGDTDLALTWMAAIPLTTLVLARAGGEGGPLARVVEHPARLLVATFFGLAAIGTALLALPAASETGSPIGLLEAAFTSVSAVCVTGLVVLDTPAAFSPVGEGLLLALIQVGGLGIMTFYTVAFAALGRRLSLRHERAVAGAMNVDDRRALVGSLRRVLVVTLVAEGAGAVLLFGAFLRHGHGVATAAWSGLFTSVSAFCNAGFALRTSSLVEYQTEPLVLHTVGALIVAGGLSPAVIAAAPAWVRGRRVGLQERLVLITTVALLAGGALTYALFEWTVSLGHLSWMDRVHNAIFQSITLRTAGFNSVDLTATRPATQTMMIAFMLIGGSPGGTAGGIKTTTLAVIVLMVGATLRGRPRARAFGRELANVTIFKAGAVTTAGVAISLVALIAVQLTQDIELEVAAFEVVSALGTVGLSLGGTTELDAIGQIIVMICMFAGRVGPLTLFLFLTERQHEPSLGFPVEEVDVG